VELAGAAGFWVRSAEAATAEEEMPAQRAEDLPTPAAVPAGTWSTASVASVAHARRCQCVSLTVNNQVGSVTFGSVLFTC
jgi:hypothetical protein